MDRAKPRSNPTNNRQLEQHLTACLHLHQPATIVLAFSGGLDSMVLLDLLHRIQPTANWTLQVVHIHHGLQPQADSWLAFCQQQCLQRGLPFASHRLQLAGRHNLEARAREARYQQLAAYCQQPGTVLVTAHHADDQLETLLLALKRGSGLDGLAGMPESRPFAGGMLLRPLLAVSKEQLEAYASQQQLSWVEDPSNQDSQYDRNFLRQQVLPLLKQRWPAFGRSALRSMDHCQQAARQLDDHWQQQLAPYLSDSDRRLSLQALHEKPLADQHSLVRAWLRRHQLNPELSWLQRLQQEVIAAKDDACPQLQLQHCWLRRFQGALYLCSFQPAAPQVSLQWQGQAELELPAELGHLQFVRTDEAPGPDWLPLLDCDSLQVVFGKMNLRFKPAKMPHSKPLKQWCRLWGIPPWQRPYLPLLVHEGRLMAVAGQASCYPAESARLWFRYTEPDNKDQA